MLGIGLAAVHYMVGFAAVGVFSSTGAINAVVFAFLFPFGLVATPVHADRMALAAVANSAFCGFVAAFVLSTWLNRKV